jgi:uncharacterized membrane protein HdeD (DUF308 family)
MMVLARGVPALLFAVPALLWSEAGAAALAIVLGVCALIAGVLLLAAAWCPCADPVAVSEVR